MNPETEQQWVRVRARLREEVGEVEYRSWLRQMVLHEVTRDEVVVALPTRFLRDWVNSHFGDRLRALWQGENRAIKRVAIVVRATGGRSAEAHTPALAEPVDPAASRAAGPAPSMRGARATAAARIDGVRAEAGRGDAADAAAAASGRHELSAPLDPRFTFDNFVVGKPNEFALACARRVAEHGPTAGFNPLFLHGGVGLGKTHLLHAMAWRLREREPAKRVVYMSAESFMYRFIAALRSENAMAFKEQLRAVDVLMVDDVQFLIGKESTQEEFFHTFNALVEIGKQVVVSADKSPADLAGLEERLRTRLGCGMVADIHATTFELRLGILQAKTATLGVPVPPKVLEFLAHKITSNVRELEGALNRVVAHAQLVGRPITLEGCQEVLRDILRAHDRRVTIEEIQRRVAEHYNIRLAEMTSARRARMVARPRQVAMYLSKQLTQRSLPEIGRKFGGRDHTTVMHAVSRVTELMQADLAFAEDVDLLRRMLES